MVASLQLRIRAIQEQVQDRFRIFYHWNSVVFTTISKAVWMDSTCKCVSGWEASLPLYYYYDITFDGLGLVAGRLGLCSVRSYTHKFVETNYLSSLSLVPCGLVGQLIRFRSCHAYAKTHLSPKALGWVTFLINPRSLIFCYAKDSGLAGCPSFRESTDWG